MIWDRWTGKGGVYSSEQDDGVEVGAEEYHGQCYLSWCLPLADDEFRAGEVQGRTRVGSTYW
jgi:hypothetical protein